mgnify:CR=1 FL=1
MQHEEQEEQEQKEVDEEQKVEEGGEGKEKSTFVGKRMIIFPFIAKSNCFKNHLPDIAK